MFNVTKLHDILVSYGFKQQAMCLYERSVSLQNFKFMTQMHEREKVQERLFQVIIHTYPADQLMMILFVFRCDFWLPIWPSKISTPSTFWGSYSPPSLWDPWMGPADTLFCWARLSQIESRYQCWLAWELIHTVSLDWLNFYRKVLQWALYARSSPPSELLNGERRGGPSPVKRCNILLHEA